MSGAVRPERRDKDAADWIGAGGTVEEIEAVAIAVADITSDGQSETMVAPDPFEIEIQRALADVRAALGRGNRKKRTPLFCVDAALLLSEQFPDPQWRVTGLITRGGTTMIGGLPKAAKKTWLATEIAVAVATGTEVCGEFFVERGTVAYFYAEDTRRQIRNRIRALLAGAGREMPGGRLHLEPRGSFIDVTDDEELAWIVASCRRHGKLDLLVLDPLSDIHSGEEDKRDSMRNVMRRLRLLGEILGCEVLAVHHAGKPSETTARRGGGQRLRGSSSIHGSVDSGIYFLECEGDGVSTFRNTVESEIKGARSAGTFTLELKIEDDDAGEAVRATWTVSRDDGRKDAQGAADDEAVFGFVRDLAMQGVHLSARALRERAGRPIPEKRFVVALGRLLKAGRLRKGTDHKVRIPPDRPGRVVRDADGDGASGANVGHAVSAPTQAPGGAMGQAPYRVPHALPQGAPDSGSEAWGQAGPEPPRAPGASHGPFQRDPTGGAR